MLGIDSGSYYFLADQTIGMWDLTILFGLNRMWEFDRSLLPIEITRSRNVTFPLKIQKGAELQQGFNMSNILCGNRKQRNTNALSLLVSEYLDLYGDSYEEEDLWWRNKELTWDEAISRAWMSRLQNGKMHGHQCLVANKLSEGLTISRIDNKQKEDFKDFQNLYPTFRTSTFTTHTSHEDSTV